MKILSLISRTKQYLTSPYVVASIHLGIRTILYCGAIYDWVEARKDLK